MKVLAREKVTVHRGREEKAKERRRGREVKVLTKERWGGKEVKVLTKERGGGKEVKVLTKERGRKGGEGPDEGMEEERR